MMRRVLFTGGYGYLGGRVAHALAARGWEVTLGSRQAKTAAPGWLPQARLARLDWDSPENLRGVCAGHDAIVHSASLSEADAARDPQEALRVNSGHSLRLLDAAMAAGAGRLIYMSTAHVYGAALTGTVDEGTLPRPLSAYAITHRVAEDFVLAAHAAGRIEAAVLRLSNGFGAPAHAGIARWSLLVNDLCRQAVVNGTLALKSAGLQQRAFIPLEDAAAGIAHVLDLPKAGLMDGLFNLGADMPMRVIDMAQLIRQRCEAVLGFRPALDVPPAGAHETAGPGLHYLSAKLQAGGFAPARRAAHEIDQTLLVCRQTFGKPASAERV